LAKNVGCEHVSWIARSFSRFSDWLLSEVSLSAHCALEAKIIRRSVCRCSAWLT